MGSHRLRYIWYPEYTIEAQSQSFCSWVFLGTQIEVFLSPDDSTIERMIDLVQDSKDEIFFMTDSITDDDLAQAIPDRAGERIVVAGFYNFSNNFQNRNNRNTQIIYNPKLAALYSR